MSLDLIRWAIAVLIVAIAVIGLFRGIEPAIWFIGGAYLTAIFFTFPRGKNGI